MCATARNRCISPARITVLPRVGQQRIPVVSVNVKKIAVQILRVGDRGLLPIITSSDFLSQLSSYRLDQLKNSDARKIWKGTLDVASLLNKDVTTAFPVLEAAGALQAGVYIMTAKPGDGLQSSDSDDDSNVATQWFVVSDLGLTALSSRDGQHVFVRSLTSAKPLAGISLRLVARDNEVLATQADRRPAVICASSRASRAAAMASRRALSSARTARAITASSTCSRARSI